MTDNRSAESSTETPFELPPSASSPAVGRELAEQLVEQARAEGLDLVCPGGPLGDLTKRVLEAGLEAEMTHLRSSFWTAGDEISARITPNMRVSSTRSSRLLGVAPTCSEW